MVLIKGWQKTSLIDYPGNVVSTIFAGGCNFRCPFCHNRDIALNSEKLKTISEEIILEHLKNNKKFLDGVCFGGGEPTLQKDLPQLCKKIKDIGLLVKLDTNGSMPEMIKKLITDKLVDYVALDVKAPWHKYNQVVGVKVDLGKIKKSMQIIINSGINHEMRTTVLPKLHSKKDIMEIAKNISKAKKYYIQQFQPTKTLIDSTFEKEKTYTKEQLENFKKECHKYVPTEIRAKD